MPVSKGVIKPLPRAQVPDWFGPRCYAASLTSIEVPILGRAYVHRRVAAAFARALQSVEEAGLGHLVDRDDYGGTYNCRNVVGSSSPSPHSWGIAMDLNVHHLARADGSEYRSASRTNYHCGPSEVPPSLRALAPHFEAQGFSWGGKWSEAYLDPMHFEATELTVKVLEGGALSPAEKQALEAARTLARPLGQGPVVVRLPGSQIVECNPHLEGDRTRCDLRALAEALGYEVVPHLDWVPPRIYLRPREA